MTKVTLLLVLVAVFVLQIVVGEYAPKRSRTYRPVPTSGRCPRFPTRRPCNFECQRDFDCRRRLGRGAICCRQGCSSTCVFPNRPIPTRPKPGQCPRNRLDFGVGSSRRCGRPCRSDNSCPGKQKCCRAGACNRICLPPVFRPRY